MMSAHSCIVTLGDSTDYSFVCTECHLKNSVSEKDWMASKDTYTCPRCKTELPVEPHRKVSKFWGK